MGFHATISAGTDAFGNERHKAAPRVMASPRVTGTAQMDKFHALAGGVTVTKATPVFSDKSLDLAFMLAGRRITDLTETLAQFRRESATRFVCQTRRLGGHIEVKKVNRKDFKGWVALYFAPGSKTGHELASVAKGQSIETNGERQDTCRAALNRMQVLLMAASN